jgi:hypothetical protein
MSSSELKAIDISPRFRLKPGGYVVETVIENNMVV